MRFFPVSFDQFDANEGNARGDVFVGLGRILV